MNNFTPFFSDRQSLTERAHKRTIRMSEIVRMTKIVLPILALTALIVIFAWPHVETYFVSAHSDMAAPAIMPEIKITNKLLNPRLSTVDAKGRPIMLQAESAIQTSERSAHMTRPQSEMELDNGQHINVQAESGHFDQEKQRFDYKHDVVLKSQDGMSFKTQQATMDLQTNQVEGSEPVTGEGPTGSLAAEGFEIKNSGKDIYLHGKSKLILNDMKSE